MMLPPFVLQDARITIADNAERCRRQLLLIALLRDAFTSIADMMEVRHLYAGQPM